MANPLPFCKELVNWKMSGNSRNPIDSCIQTFDKSKARRTMLVFRRTSHFPVARKFYRRRAEMKLGRL